MRVVEKLAFAEFEWDETKRARTLSEREIDFVDAAVALLEPHLEEASNRQGEARTLALCNIKGAIVAVIYTVREPGCRIISARAARRYERQQYREVFGR
ncbi:BrnT family toxin [Chelativorans sp. ZYF759]|uniref:BrnT family toxin n=1 Tax=Chelativorans sp. ZYF759 TaxID=2692213 RepID=UPI00145E5078|nr:BrnT family toxin [Chelativorans sp. ZYF759]NMG40570.1 BrnT family toxin [Chelativorans sp. ZYF759]